MSVSILYGKNAGHLVALAVDSSGLIQTTSTEVDGLEALIGTTNSTLGTMDGDTGAIKTATEVLSASDGAKATHALQTSGNTLLGSIDSDTNDIKGSVATIALNTAVVAPSSTALYATVSKSAGDYSTSIDMGTGEQKKNNIMIVGLTTTSNAKISITFSNAAGNVWYSDGTYANLYTNAAGSYEFAMERTNVPCRYLRILFQNAAAGVILDYHLS